MLCCKQDWKQQQRKRAQARGGVWNFALQGVMIGLTFCQAAAYAICFVMVFDRMGNIQGVVCDIWLIWLAVLVLRMRCFRACFSTRDGGGAGGDAIWSRPVSFHSLPWFGSCHLGIAGDCYAAEDCYVWMPWPFVSELSASAVFGSPEMMACVLISFAECLCCLGLRQYNSFTHLEAKCFLTIRYIWLR